MTQMTSYMLLLIFAIMLGIVQYSNGEDYNKNHLEHKCCTYNSNHDCCVCVNGTCSTPWHGFNKPNPHLQIQTQVIIGVGVSIVCVGCLIIAAIYWHGKQMKNTEKRLNPLASFSQSSTLSRKGTSAGVRVRSSTSQSPSLETSVNLGLPTSNTPKIETV